jgi:predicted homoserine dehydrogenase-like protein
MKDNRGQVLYAVIVAVMFVGMLSMLTLGLTLRNYQAAAQKQQHVTDYYAADAVAELIRIGKIKITVGQDTVINAATFDCITDSANFTPDSIFVKRIENVYTITCGTVTIEADIDIEAKKFNDWEVSYHAVETQAEQ